MWDRVPRVLMGPRLPHHRIRRCGSWIVPIRDRDRDRDGQVRSESPTAGDVTLDRVAVER
jgi:hypothetical protein